MWQSILQTFLGGDRRVACIAVLLSQQPGLGEGIKQNNLILQLVIPPARERGILAFNAEMIFKNYKQVWIGHDGLMQRKSLAGVWSLLGALGWGSCAGCPGASCRCTLTARRAGNRLTCPELSNCCHLPSLARNSSTGRAVGAEGEASMVIRMNCLELLRTRNELLSSAWGK